MTYYRFLFSYHESPFEGTASASCAVDQEESRFVRLVIKEE